jgi:CBS domain-containing protein
MKVETILQNKGNQVVTMPPDATIDAAAKLMLQLGIGAVMICDEQNQFCGVLAERDIVHGLADHGSHVLAFPVRSLMRHEVSTCKPEDQLNAIMEMMTDRRVRHVPVRDEHGDLCGVISVGDVVKARIDEIEREARELRDYIAMA